MPLTHLALVVESKRVSPSEIKEVAAAVQRQISRDFAPIWGLEATIDPFIALEDVPPGYWPILVRDDFPGMSITGIHQDARNQPFALVRVNPTWSLTVSHEALEMVADPFCNRLVPGQSPMRGQGMVEFLLEVCDPCGGVAYTYTVNGYLVSNFYTPNYFDPVPAPGTRYCFTGALDRPRGILPGGTLAWCEPASGDWWQCDWIDRPRPRFSRIGPVPAEAPALREIIDSRYAMPDLYNGAPADHPNVIRARERRAMTLAASRARAGDLRRRIAALTARAGPG